ncbi:hypothetical protein ACJX0J_021861 [Zea mays]
MQDGGDEVTIHASNFLQVKPAMRSILAVAQANNNLLINNNLVIQIPRFEFFAAWSQTSQYMALIQTRTSHVKSNFREENVGIILYAPFIAMYFLPIYFLNAHASFMFCVD